MAVTQFTLSEGQRAERKLLLTVAEWEETTGSAGNRLSATC